MHKSFNSVIKHYSFIMLSKSDYSSIQIDKSHYLQEIIFMLIDLLMVDHKSLSKGKIYAPDDLGRKPLYLIHAVQMRKGKFALSSAIYSDSPFSTLLQYSLN